MSAKKLVAKRAGDPTARLKTSPGHEGVGGVVVGDQLVGQGDILQNARRAWRRRHAVSP